MAGPPPAATVMAVRSELLHQANSGGGLLGGQVGSLLGNPLVLVLIAAYVLIRQFVARTVDPRRLLLMPAVLLFLGLSRWSPPNAATAGGLAALGLLAFNVAVAVALGLARGLSMRTWRDAAGAYWVKGTLLTAGLWVATILVRLATMGLSVAAGFSMGDLRSELPLLLGITIGAQNLVVWLRTSARTDLAAAPDQTAMPPLARRWP